MRYPEALRQDIVDTIHGREIPDPYRWLEDVDAPETIAWGSAQDELVEPFLQSLPGRDHLRRRLEELTPGHIGAPQWAGERAFISRRYPGQEHAQYLVVEPDGEERLLLDPSALSDDDTITLDATLPSKDGSRLAYFLSEAGTESQALWVMDVSTGENIEGPVDVGRGGHFAWLPGSEELILVRRLPDLPEDEAQFHRRVWRHRIGTPSSDDHLLFGDGRDKSTYYGLNTSLDGRWLVVSCSVGTEPRNDLYLFDLAKPDAEPVCLQQGEDVHTSAWVDHDGTMYLYTNRDAPRDRLLVADPENPFDTRELVPESDAVLSTLAVTDDALVVGHGRHATTELSVRDKRTGELRYEIPLPGLGVASVSSRPTGGDEVWISYTDHVTPLTVLHHRISTRETTTWATAPGMPELPAIKAERVFVTSKDGTRIPMFVVALADRTGPVPATLGGYGGFNVSQSPGYAAGTVAWVEAGGIYASACLRGGSEYGEEWHRAGMRENKQNVFDDFIACADWLVDQGYTTRDQLSIAGGSNGGLLVGAVLTQRPDLCAAVVCSAPLLDMIRYEKFGLGVTWNDEYGTADSPEELGWLAAYSPYHQVKEGTQYPAVLFTTFGSDTRVDPLHARKMCAALQHATTSDPKLRPIMLRHEQKVGHGQRSVSRTIELTADSTAFRAFMTGLKWPE